MIADESAAALDWQHLHHHTLCAAHCATSSPSPLPQSTKASPSNVKIVIAASLRLKLPYHSTLSSCVTLGTCTDPFASPQNCFKAVPSFLILVKRQPRWLPQRLHPSTVHA